jgi:FkbM family methyltransferase
MDASALAAATDRDARIEARLDRLADDVQFLKRHLSTYLGGGGALTYLADESPIFVNSDDRAGPMNLINGGLFEEANLEVLLSYLKPHAYCLDIGANLGFFSLKLAKRLRPPGKVMAFEPHPMLCELMDRTLLVNGVRKMVTICNYGLSDREAAATFHFPLGHLGGGHIADGDAAHNAEAIPGQLRRLDDVLAPGTVVDLVKIDVEQHELHVLRGMGRVIAESPDIVILFEKLARAGNTQQIEEYLKEFGIKLFAVLPNANLQALTGSAFETFHGYVLALRSGSVGSLQRSRFSIYPPQLWSPNTASPMPPESDRIVSALPRDKLFFYGPYWFLRCGHWRLSYVGKIKGCLNLTITEHFGRRVADLVLDGAMTEGVFVADHDLVYFECAARSGSADTRIELERLELERIT